MTTLAAAIAVTLCGSAPVLAASISFSATFEFSGATAPSGPGPWIRATFTDMVGGVELELESLLQDSGEFINLWMFNLDPALDPTDLNFAFLSGSPNTAVITTGVNAFQADGDGRFDIQFDWPQMPSGRFNGADVVKYTITSEEPISAASFDFQSVQGGGEGTFPMAAHIQGIGDDGEDSGWVSTPEPGSAAFMLAGLALAIPRRRSR